MTLFAAETRPPSRKTTLYCFDCGHESPVDGDWILQPNEDTVDYTCPTCRTTITTRPRPDRRPVEHDPAPSPCAGD